MNEFYPRGDSHLSKTFFAPKRHPNLRVKRRQPRWRRLCRFYYLRFLRFRGKPREIARGLAVGVFAGCFPFFGLQTVIGVLLAAILKGSKVAAAAGTWISNPLTYVPIFVFNFKVGKLLLGIETPLGEQLDLESFSSFMELGVQFAVALLSGSLLVGSIIAIVTYFVSFRLFKRLRERQRKRHWRKYSR